MRRLPIFPEIPLPEVQKVHSLDKDPNCNLCELSQSNPEGKRCLPAEGEPGDILVVLDHPTEFERHLGRPAASQSGRWLRELIARIAPDRKVVYTYALGCKPAPGMEAKDLVEPVEACRPYLHGILKDADPKVVLLFDGLAGLGFLGRSFQPLSVRKGFGWFFRQDEGGFMDPEPRPAFLLGDPSYAMRNKLIARALEEDLRAALLGPLPVFRGLDATYQEVRTEEDAVEAMEVLLRGPFTAMDSETSGMLHEPDFRVECVAVSNGEDTYVWGRDAIENPAVVGALAVVLEEQAQATWNGQYDLVAMECEPLIKGQQVSRRNRWILNLQSDSRIKRKLFEADAKADLGTAAELVGMGGHKAEAHTLITAIGTELRKLAMARHPTPTGRKRPEPELRHLKKRCVPDEWFEYLDQGFDEEKFAYRYLDTRILHRYCARDALTSFYLEEWCNDRLIENPNLHMVWDEVAQPAMWAWCCARLTGFPTDKKRVELLRDYLNVEIDKLGLKIQAHEPGLNPNAPQQVVKALEKRGFKSKRKTVTGQKQMDKGTMEEFKGKHPLVDLILAWKMYKHTQDNFAEGLLPYIRSDGRVHPSFLQDGTETGRPSSSDPNFFNRLKGRDEESRKLGTMLRECHAMPPGWTLLEADEGQIEIREVMDLCDDPLGIGIIRDSNVDFHMASAKRFATVLGKDPEKVTDIDRERAKTTNFAAIYELPEQLGFMLSKRLGISSKEGNDLATALFGSYTNLLPWMKVRLNDCTQTGHSVTRWRGKEARHRPLWHLGLPPPNPSDREKSADKTRWQNHARSSWNGEAQGSAVDIITSMIWKAQLWLDANTNGGQFLLQIYDSIMLMVRDEDVDKTIAYLQQLMTDNIPGQKVGYLQKVPLAIDVKKGRSWGQMEKVKLK